MPDNPSLDSKLVAPPPDRQAYRPFPELASAIRSQAERILDEWRGRTLLSMPELAELTVKEFKDDIATILSRMADALESNEPPDLQRLMRAAPMHGFHRFLQKYELSDLFAEERVLRRVIVDRVEESLGRQCKPDAAAALHSMIDIMLQQGVIALVEERQNELRRASETQLKYLSFLSHDLNNNFLVITMNLRFIESQLASLPHMKESAEVLAAAMSTIHRTREGMREMLKYGQLRQADTTARRAVLNLRDIVEPIVKVATSDKRGKGMTVEVDIDPAITVYTNADLLTIILQNLVGNAVKHACDAGTDGSIRVHAEPDPGLGSGPGAGKGKGLWIISVTDNGPGIPHDQIERMFLAFQQLADQKARAVEDDSGFGLGLAIASEAARLLDTKIEVATHEGRGSSFSFRVAAKSPAAG